MNFQCRLFHSKHEAWGKVMAEKKCKGCHRNVDTEGLMDTGSQVCITRSDMLTQIGIDCDYLLPTTMSIKGVITKSMMILGVMFIEF